MEALTNLALEKSLSGSTYLILGAPPPPVYELGQRVKPYFKKVATNQYKLRVLSVVQLQVMRMGIVSDEPLRRRDVQRRL